jgi:hypothetical protein
MIVMSPELDKVIANLELMPQRAKASKQLIGIGFFDAARLMDLAGAMGSRF